MERKRHLARRTRVPACGTRYATHFTRNPAEVTCLGCQRTLYMADAEVLWRRSRTSKRERERRTR